MCSRFGPVVGTSGGTAVDTDAGGLLGPVTPDDAGDEVVSTLFRQAGILRAATLAEQFDLALLLATQPLPAGNGVAIVTNAGGPAALAAAAARANGLRIVRLSDATVSGIRSCAPAGWPKE